VSKGGLTTKQRLFVESYLSNGFNATEAARAAGYKQPHSQGPRLLENVGVSAVIEARLNEAKMTADEVLRELGEIARAPWKNFVEVKYGEEGEILNCCMRLTDKLKALELVGKHHKLFTEKHEHGFNLSNLSDEDLKTLERITSKLT
jgi:phage terminase small subunit